MVKVNKIAEALIVLIITTIFILLDPFTAKHDCTRAQSNRSDPHKLRLIKTEIIKTGMGVKSVELSPDGSRVYSMNLEECSVFEFNRESRKIQRKIVFVQHRGRGFNYKKRVWISSYQEKPVEAHFTHGGRYLWISLHNAGGIVVWDLLDGDTHVRGRPYKTAWYYETFKEDSSRVISPEGKEGGMRKSRSPRYKKEKIRLLWIKTGSTPKVIASSPDGRYLFVANWHSHSVSVLEIGSQSPEEWRVIGELTTGRIPRGLVVSPDSRYLYIAQMGSNHISVVDTANMKKIHQIVVGVNPRHLVISKGHIFSSLNIAGKLIKIDQDWKIVGSVNTLPSPRTVAVSQDGLVIFVVCYDINYLQAFSADSLKDIGRFQSSGHPVGVTVYQSEDAYEVWVGNYSSGTIRIFTFSR
jgi:YVTN family beta-propeller protein